MDQVHVIRHKVLVEGQPIRQVAREMAISRNTVRKYLKEPEPKRTPDRQARSKPVLERVAPRIEELLSEWSVRTTAKQRITGTRLHRQLVEEGEQVGITTVRQYLREKRRQVAEVYIPLVHRAGDAAQVDFFEVTVDVGRMRRVAWKFVMRLMHSGWDFAWIYDRCDQVSFLDGHVRALAQLGGVPARLVYDNLSLAVRKMTFPDRQLTERFQALASAYLFEPCFTRPGQGHDKGGVEARGKGIRLQHLTPIPQGESLRQISEKLLQDLATQAGRKRRRDGQTVQEIFEQERQLLRPLPAVPFDPRAVELVSVSRSALVRVQGAQYSVPSHWKLLDATAYVGVEQVSIVCRGEETVVPRQPKGERHVRYRHYHQELARKPAAVRQVAPELIAELGEPYDRLYRMLQDAHGGLGAARVLAKILGAIGEHGEEAVREALMAALELDRVELLGLGKKVHKESRPRVVVVPDQLKGIEVQSARATDYDWMLAGGAV